MLSCPPPQQSRQRQKQVAGRDEEGKPIFTGGHLTTSEKGKTRDILADLKHSPTSPPNCSNPEILYSPHRQDSLSRCLPRKTAVDQPLASPEAHGKTG